MNEALKQFSADLLKDFQAALIKNETVVSKIKSAADGGTFKVIISTSDEDRQGDTLDQSKWKLDNYKKNPVVLWAHDYSTPPIGICTGISIEGGKLVAEGKFAPAELNPFAGQIAGLYESGFINTTSVGYIMHEDGQLELLEFSFVPVPANPYALSLREVKKLHLDMAELVMKGLQFKVKAEEVGGHCEQDDGTPGILAEDPDNPGTMVCVPASGDKANKTDNGDMNNELIKNLKAEHKRHGEAVGKAIDEFSEKCMKSEAQDHYDKAIDEFKDEMDGEQSTHLDKCMKAIDEDYKLEDQKKGVDEFKSEVKDEHLKHVKAFHKAISGLEEVEHPGDGEDLKPMKDAIDEFTTKAGAELVRHEKAQIEMAKAEMGEGEEDGKALTDVIAKTGRQISSKNKEKLAAILKAIEEHHADLEKQMDDHKKSIDEFQASHKTFTHDVTAALKELMTSGDGGEEPSKKPEDDESDGEKALKERSRTSGASAIKKEPSELEAYLFTQRLVRQIKTASENGLRQIKTELKKKYPGKKF